MKYTESHHETGLVPVIDVHGLVTQIDGEIIHDGLNLVVTKGDILGVVGASGSGKTVLMETLVGLRRPFAGTVRVFGHNPLSAVSSRSSDIRRRWGVLFQAGGLFSNFTVLENVAFVVREQTNLRDRRIINDISRLYINMCGLPDNAFDLLPSELSGGMGRRAALARALVLDPELLVLDEPTSGLDPIEANNFDYLVRDMCHTFGLTAFIITHDFSTLEVLCSRKAVLTEGKLLEVSSAVEAMGFFR